MKSLVAAFAAILTVLFVYFAPRCESHSGTILGAMLIAGCR